MSASTADDLDTLANVAARAVRDAVIDGRCWVPNLDDFPTSLTEPAAVFVTLRQPQNLDHRDRLRGCVGTLDPRDPLVIATADRARAAAFDDPRFEAVRPDELTDLMVSVSVLSSTEPLDVDSYDELLDVVRPGVDGIVIAAGRHRATFLPSVWEELPRPAAFLEALWRKASLPARAWPPGMRTWRYSASHSRDVPVRS